MELHPFTAQEGSLGDPFETPQARAPATGPLAREVLEAHGKLEGRIRRSGQLLAELAEHNVRKLAELEKVGWAPAGQLAAGISALIREYAAACHEGRAPAPPAPPEPPPPSNPAAQGRGKKKEADWAAVAKAPPPPRGLQDSRHAARGARPAHPHPALPAFPGAGTDRILVRLPEGHWARAAPFTARQRLQKELPSAAAAEVKTVERIRTGVAVVPIPGAVSLPASLTQISAAFGGAVVEKDEKWAFVLIPRCPRTYQEYDGRHQEISGPAAAEEFKTQTGLQPIRAQWAPPRQGALGDGDRESGTGLLLVALTLADYLKAPNRVSFFGDKLPLRRKPLIPPPRVRQCTRCWGYHEERKCERKKRCRLCADDKHTEEGHPASECRVGGACGCGPPDRCTNCRGPHAADDLGCPVRPAIANKAVQYKTKAQVEAIKETQAPKFGKALADALRKCVARKAPAAQALAPATASPSAPAPPPPSGDEMAQDQGGEVPPPSPPPPSTGPPAPR